MFIIVLNIVLNIVLIIVLNIVLIIVLIIVLNIVLIIVLIIVLEPIASAKTSFFLLKISGHLLYVRVFWTLISIGSFIGFLQTEFFFQKLSKKWAYVNLFSKVNQKCSVYRTKMWLSFVNDHSLLPVNTISSL